MSEEDQLVDVGALPKFDMPLYTSDMTVKDVKSLALRHGIPLDLHPVALTKEWSMDKLPDDMIGLYEQYLEFSGIRVPFFAFLRAVIKHFRVHISQLVPLGLNRLTMFELYCRSLGIVPFVNLFCVFYKISKQGHWFSFEKKADKGAGGQIFRETFSRLKGWKKRFFFLDRRAIPDAMAWRHHDSDVNDPIPEDGFRASDVQMLTEQVIDLRPVPSGLLFLRGLATTWEFPGFGPVFKDTEGNDQIKQHIARPLLSDRAIPEKTDHQKSVEVEDPKIVSIRERKARVAAKKREKKRQGGDGGEGSRPATKRRKTSVRKGGSAASEASSSPEPIQTIKPAGPTGVVAETAESREDRSPRASPRGSADHFVHTYSDIHHDNEEARTLRLGTFRDQSGKVITPVDTEVVQPSLSPRTIYHSPVATQPASPPRPLQQEMSFGHPLWCRELMVHLAPPAAQEESNALNNTRALDRAWFSLAQGALAQTDILERFENLQADFDELAESHSECGDLVGKLVQARLDVMHSFGLYNSPSDRFKALRIKELEDELARKDSALVYAERLNGERAQEREKLVTQLSKTEMEKFDCARKLLPTVGKGLTEERSERDLADLMSRMEGFDVYADTKMKVEYDKLFEKRYPYVEKISRGFRHSV
ncbi:hypothetical protein Tco_0462176 [Tanacetum coccineum]